MDLSTIIGIVIAFGAVVFAGAVGGADPKVFIENWDAFVLVFGGTVGATMTGYPLNHFIPGVINGLKTAIKSPKHDEREVISTLVSFAEKARREGLLVLESEAEAIDDPFLKRGIQLVIDGRDTDIIRKILETEVNFVAERDSKSSAIFAAMGGFSPTLGIIGTVLGLINMLKGLGDLGGGANPAAKMGQATASAFVATFFGVLFANLLFLPISAKLKERIAETMMLREIMIEGILSIQAGDSPRLLEEKLLAFLDPAKRVKEENDAKAGAGATAAPSPA